MARRRFLVDQIQNNNAELRGNTARHLARVLRAQPGQQYEISDGAQVYLAEVSEISKDRVTFRVLEPVDAPPAAVRLTIFAALIKFDRFEWLVEKATELGVSAIVPVNTARSEKGLMEAARKRSERWRRIACESSQQARRLQPPEISGPQEFRAAITAEAGIRYFLEEQPGATPLIVAVPAPEKRRPSDSVGLLIGPEGGWTDSERAEAAAAGWTPVSLGSAILRAETAGLAAAALLTHVWWASQLE